jgi:DNA-binding beta-propeller fold protein YncE
MAVDKNDNVYVVDSELAQLFIIKNNKNEAIVVSLDESLTQPTSVAIDSNDNSLYITDTATHQIKQFSANGKLKSIIGKRGTAEGEFNYPTMIWKDKAGQLYVTDSLNFRIQIFDRGGNFIKTFGKQGGGSGELSRPKGVATDNDGHVYVVDGLFHVFQLFDKSGNFLLHVGGQGQGKGEFWLPSGIFIKDNVIYVADSFNRRVQVFRYLGEQS